MIIIIFITLMKWIYLMKNTEYENIYLKLFLVKKRHLNTVFIILKNILINCSCIFSPACTTSFLKNYQRAVNFKNECNIYCKKTQYKLGSKIQKSIPLFVFRSLFFLWHSATKKIALYTQTAHPPP